MELEFVPLLQIQRDLYTIPRGMGRFHTYLKTMVGSSVDDIELPPLVAMNPMGKDHVPALLDAYIGFGADEIGASATVTARGAVGREPGTYKVALVIADDKHGGWTNRWSSEFTHRFEEAGWYTRGWIVGILWTGDLPDPTAVREEVLTSIYRVAYVQRHGAAMTLSDMLAQEGAVMAMAGCTAPALDAEDLEYTRAVIEPLLHATDRATVMACLFGDEAANAFGYPPQGLSRRAGLALALERALVGSRGELSGPPRVYGI